MSAGDNTTKQTTADGTVIENQADVDELNSLTPADEGLTPGIVATAALLVAILLGLGWYLGTRAADERLTAVVAELPGSDRYSDDFVRPEPGDEGKPVLLGGLAPNGANWSTIGTEFLLEGGLATISPIGDDTIGIAIIDTGWSNANIGATFDHAPAGTGLVFRFRDIENYWALTSSPESGTWTLTLVVNGETVLSEPIGLASVSPGARVSILAQGAEIQTFVNGEPLLSIVDPHFELASAVGIISTGSTDGSFSDFFALEAASMRSE